MSLYEGLGGYQPLIITGSLLITIFYFLYKYATKDFNYWQERGIPYIKPMPFVGNLKDVVTFKRAMGHALGDLYFQATGPLIGIWCFNVPHLIIRSPELMSQVLIQNFNHFNDRAAGVERKVDPISANLLFMLKYSEWKPIRLKMAPIFSSAKMKAMMPLLYEVVEDMLKYVDRLPDGVIEAKEFFAKYTTDGITSCAFGLQSNSFNDENSPFRIVGRKMFETGITNVVRSVTYFLWPKVATLFKIRFIHPALANFFQTSFWQVVKERKRSNLKRNDLIDIFIKLQNEHNDGVVLDDVQLVSQAIIFFLGGFETTSSTMAFTLYELSINKSIQDSLRSEIKSTLSKYGSFTYEAIFDMHYLHQVLMETLRKYPSLPFIDRRCVKDYKIPDSNVVIEAGTPILIPMFGIHYDPEIYPDPEKFDPERFSNENLSKIPNCAHIPFGAGPRVCAGEKFGILNMKLGLAEVLAKYEVVKTDKTPSSVEFDMKSLMLTVRGGLPLRLVKINENHVL